MAIIPCAECAHQVSDQAASCPSCGAPFARAVKTKPRGKRVISRTLITLMALWTLGTLLWLLVPSGASDQTHRTEGAPRQATADQPSASVLPVSNQPAPALRSEYRTTAEQLFRDYEANVVATQTRIGASRVRLTGSVAEIDQDAAGRPVVKLWFGKDSTAAMTLVEDQGAAAAQLAKGETVEIECDKLGRRGALLQGSDCILALVDFRAKEVGVTHTSRLKRAPTNSPANGTTLASTVARATMESNAESSGSAAARDDGHDSTAAQPMPVPVVDSMAVPPARATSLAPTAASVGAGLPAPAPLVAEHITTNNIRLASAGNSDTGTAAARVPSEESTVAHATQNQTTGPVSLQGASRGTISTGTTAIPDDLGRVRAADPQAADHITSYCAQTTVSNNRDTFIADCRRSEAEAWTRLVLQNEFPTLDEATRRKCSEPPFPDTYVAKESCARYVLHVN